jgi:hypothetical protein
MAETQTDPGDDYKAGKLWAGLWSSLEKPGLIECWPGLDSMQAHQASLGAKSWDALQQPMPGTRAGSPTSLPRGSLWAPAPSRQLRPGAEVGYRARYVDAFAARPGPALASGVEAEVITGAHIKRARQRRIHERRGGGREAQGEGALEKREMMRPNPGWPRRALHVALVFAALGLWFWAAWAIAHCDDMSRRALEWVPGQPPVLHASSDGSSFGSTDTRR